MTGSEARICSRDCNVSSETLLHLEDTRTLFSTTDWTSTELGAVHTWPKSLRGFVSMVLDLPWPAIIFWGDNQLQLYNDGYAVIMGPRHPRYFGASYRDCWPDTYPTIYPWMRKVLDHGEVIEVQRTHIPLTRFGFDEEAYFTFIFSPLRDDEGRIAGILQPVFEVTAEVLAERRAEMLRTMAISGRSADPLPALATAMNGCRRDVPFALIWLRDETGALKLASSVGEADDTAAAIVQFEAAAATATASNQPAELTELHITGCGVDGEIPAAHRALALPLDGGSSGTTLGAIVFGISARQHFDERYRQFLEQTAHQIATSLRQASALQEMERRRNYLSEIFMQAPAGIAILSGPEHVFELVNPIYRSMIGDRDVVGMPIRRGLPELEGQPFFGILDDVYRTGIPYVGRELPAQLVSSEGETRSIVFTFLYQPMRDAYQAITGILVMCYDVTAHVKERERAEALALELSQEHKRKDEFLAMLAHELRNPLAPISSAADVLRRGGVDAERQQWLSQLIARQVKHMAGLVDDLLDVSRVTRGLVNIDRQPLSVSEVVSEAVEQVRPLMEARRHHLTVELPVDQASVWVLGDRKRLVQVLSNLLTNAAKYTADGGMVAVEVSIQAAEVRIVVRDNGIGMPTDLLPRVFDLFVQAERTGDRAQGGLGIGLALVKTLVELHGGAVTAASEGLGQGSEFTVRLPRTAHDPHQPDIGSRTDSHREVRAAKSVLVVEDNIDVSQALGLQLELHGHRVRIENDSTKGLFAARQELPDVCLLDIGLPGFDGCELARQLRVLPGAEQLLLIGMSGYGQSTDRERALAAGFDHYLVKPVNPDVLQELIADHG